MALPYIPGNGVMSQRTFGRRTRLEEMTNFEIRKHCAMDLIHVRELLDLLSPALKHPTSRSQTARPETQLISALSFFRSGSFQYVEGTVAGTSQATVSRVLERISTHINENLVSEYIRFPTSLAELNSIKEAFHDIAQLPNTIGIIDGSHKEIKAPSEEEPSFVNRKGVHSINIQLVCAPNNTFTDAVVKWPGATHDSYMWNNCGLKRRFENGEFGESWLIGDSGYGVEPFLLTPYGEATTREQGRYNRALKKTRSIVERSIGIWKSRFRSMDKSGGLLCYKPAKCCKLILSSLFLHNYCIRRNVPLGPEDEAYALNYVDDMTAPVGIFEHGSGFQTRDNLVYNYFSG